LLPQQHLLRYPCPCCPTQLHQQLHVLLRLPQFHAQILLGSSQLFQTTINFLQFAVFLLQLLLQPPLCSIVHDHLGDCYLATLAFVAAILLKARSTPSLCCLLC
jgi:hypothetical protein